ncbi:MAG: multidrug efflux MFS transporter [Candidatus Nomurabacteria bacterium]|jgi:EmrB/QacA subfamily drug resistance transporter|nr:multidrug efflux MFS transporter [Candidatus Nomurabacteria bacterium]
MTEKLSKHNFLMVAIIVVGGFVTILNQTVISPALPSIMAKFSISAATGQWLTTIFMLVMGIMIPISAWLIGRFSTRQVFIAALGMFVCGTLLCALAPSFQLLLIGRVLQAIGTGVQMPFVSVTVMQLFPKERRGFALGIVGVVIGAAPAIGPTLSGYLVDALGWRAIFWVTIPLAIILIILALIKLTNLTEAKAGKLDVLSVILSTLGFGGILLGASEAGDEGWLSALTIAPLILGILILIWFVRRQLKLKQPLLDVGLLKNGTLAVATALSALVMAGMTVAAVVMPIYLQTLHHETALMSGLIMLPGAVLMAAMSPVSGKLFDRYGPKPLAITGLFLLAGGSLLLTFVKADTSLIYLAAVYALRFFGISLVNMPLTNWGINALLNHQIPHGNAIINTARQVGGSIGSAVLVTVMTIASSGAPGGASVAGVNAAFTGTTILMAVGFISALIVFRRVKIGSSYDER